MLKGAIGLNEEYYVQSYDLESYSYRADILKGGEYRLLKGIYAFMLNSEPLMIVPILQCRNGVKIAQPGMGYSCHLIPFLSSCTRRSCRLLLPITRERNDGVVIEISEANKTYTCNGRIRSGA